MFAVNGTIPKISLEPPPTDKGAYNPLRHLSFTHDSKGLVGWDANAVYLWETAKGKIVKKVVDVPKEMALQFAQSHEIRQPPARQHRAVPPRQRRGGHHRAAEHRELAR